jgi:dihydrofolate synthase/folylpolyglutamate synthase
MTFEETTAWLYSQLPVFQRTGGGAHYKIDLEKTEALMKALDHPEQSFSSIHVGGTNGKGSTSHLLASVLQTAGYRVGLYTSPHLIDFRERIRINGIPLAQVEVVSFVEEHRTRLEGCSFFEATVGMAFDAFRRHRVDVAVVEVGLGGRLDSTNVIHPEVAVVTSIGLDHQAYLGTTRAAIAGEKAGIFKTGIPVVVGEKDPETAAVFEARAREVGAHLHWAEELVPHPLPCGLHGAYQAHNVRCVQAALQLQTRWKVSPEHLRIGLMEVVQRTGLRGRWEVLQSQGPRVVADTGHNAHGLRPVVAQLLQECPADGSLHAVVGTVADKDPSDVLALLPRSAHYYWVQADLPRALPASALAERAAEFGLRGRVSGPVARGLEEALREAQPQDLVFVGGSIFVVAEALAHWDANPGTSAGGPAA